MTLQEIKDQVAQAHGYDNWNSIQADCYHWGLNDLINKAMLAAIEEDRKDAAEKAKVISSKQPYIGMVWDVDKSSITDRPLPDLK